MQKPTSIISTSPNLELLNNETKAKKFKQNIVESSQRVHNAMQTLGLNPPSEISQDQSQKVE